MSIKTLSIGTLALIGLIVSSLPAAAQTAKEKAADEGARQLTPDEIAQWFTGRTGTWVSADGDMRAAIFYGENNDL